MGKRNARSEGGSVSHISFPIRPEIIVIPDDDDGIREIKASTPPGRQTSRLSLFVTPGPDEPRTTGTPETRWRSMSARQQRRTRQTSSAPPPPDMINIPVIDLTAEDSDKGSVEPEDDTTNGADEAEDGVPDLFNPGTKRARLTSPASDGGGDTKRQKSKLTACRSGSLPIQAWSFPSV